MTETSLALPPDHPLRRAAVDEMRARRFPAVPVPARIVQVVTQVDPADRAGERGYVGLAAEALGGATIAMDRSLLASRGPLTLVWERHSEASTYTLIHADKESKGFAYPSLHPLPQDWFAAIPGKVVRATLIAVADAGDPDAPRWAEDDPDEPGGDPTGDMVSCTVEDGAARIWSDFRLYPDGFGRLLVHNRTLGPHDLGRVIQRVQELSNYRNMALLGLPTAQDGAARLNTLEAALADYARDVAEGRLSDEALLTELSSLSAELATIGAATGFRMGATRAYAQVATDRLAALGIGRVAGYQSLTDYTERRLIPAVRTCVSFSDRLSDLTERAADITALLRTRIETRMGQQSRDLLESMNANARRQLELQHLVERFSVVAISYYAIGLLLYAAKALQHGLGWPDPIFLAGAAVPVVVALVLWRLSREAPK